MSEQSPLEPTQNAFPDGYLAAIYDPYTHEEIHPRTAVGIPPPPPRKRRIWPLILVGVGIVLVVVTWYGGPPTLHAIQQPALNATATSIALSNALATNTAATALVATSIATDDATATASSVEATATQKNAYATATASVPTPTPLPVINTAQDIYMQFITAGIAMGNEGDLANSWWSQCCSYNPGRGSLSFTDETSSGLMVIALFNTVSGAQTTIAQMNLNSSHPGDYQLGSCVLLYWSASTNLTPYEQVMQQYCL